eukprot:gene17201-23521_t
MSEFFKFVVKKRQPAFVKRFLRELESGAYQVPRSFDVLARYNTEELKLDTRSQRLKLAFPEDRLMKDFMKRYLEAKLQPIELGSFCAPLAKQFALRQLQLMEGTERMSKEASFAQVEGEMAAQLRALSGTKEAQGTRFLVRLAHQEEEHHLRAALIEVSDQRARQGLPVLISRPGDESKRSAKEPKEAK